VKNAVLCLVAYAMVRVALEWPSFTAAYLMESPTRMSLQQVQRIAELASVSSALGALLAGILSWCAFNPSAPTGRQQMRYYLLVAVVPAAGSISVLMGSPLSVTVGLVMVALGCGAMRPIVFSMLIEQVRPSLAGFWSGMLACVSFLGVSLVFRPGSRWIEAMGYPLSAAVVALVPVVGAAILQVLKATPEQSLGKA